MKDTIGPALFSKNIEYKDFVRKKKNKMEIIILWPFKLNLVLNLNNFFKLFRENPLK
jgi:hypothetical protein